MGRAYARHRPAATRLRREAARRRAAPNALSMQSATLVTCPVGTGELFPVCGEKSPETCVAEWRGPRAQPRTTKGASRRPSHVGLGIRGSTAARVLAAAGARVTRAGALHHAAALVARRAEVEAHPLGGHDRWGVGEGRRRRHRTAVARARALAAVRRRRALLHGPRGVGLLAGPSLRGEDAELLVQVDVAEAAGEPAHDVVG